MTTFATHTIARLSGLFREHVVLAAEVDPTIAGYAATRGAVPSAGNEQLTGAFPGQQSTGAFPGQQPPAA